MMFNDDRMIHHGGAAAPFGASGLRAGSTVVIKYGGAAMSGEAAESGFARDVVALRNAGVNVVVVHGGGEETTRMAARLGVEVEFVQGHRRTDETMIEIVTMVLGGRVNKNITRLINLAGAAAIGLCGVDHELIRARKLDHEAGDLGLVGEVESVNVEFIRLLLGSGIIPVIAPLGLGKDGEVYNINADPAAAAIAAALNADALIYMSNIAGIDVGGIVAGVLTTEEGEELIACGTISGGMIPKVRSAFAALKAGVRSVRIIDGRVPHILPELLSGRGTGTAIVNGINASIFFEEGVLK
ncbi:MAG: acetylglutamate kinase [Chlorobi bacterium]|nr:acetylglutamate kinase [Chlorobiota bacterium]